MISDGVLALGRIEERRIHRTRPDCRDRDAAIAEFLGRGTGEMFDRRFQPLKGMAVCSNRATITRDEIEDRVLGGLKEHLLHPDLVAAFIEEYRHAWNEAQAGAGADRDKVKRQLTQTEKKIAAMLTAIEDGMYHPSMKEKMAALEAQKTDLTAELVTSPEPPVLRLHPSLTEHYRAKVADLAAALSDPSIKPAATEALRGLISEIRMLPDEGSPGGHRIELEGEIAAIMALGAPDTRTPRHLAGAVAGRSGTVVAGACSHRNLPELKCAV